MNELNFFSKRVFFTTREFAFAIGVASPTASRKLRRMDASGDISNVTRGIWCQPHHPFFSPFGGVPYLLGNEHGYISFLTALHRHGIISQIPRVIQVATTGHGRNLSSAIGEYEFFHIQPSLMRDGVESNAGKLQYNIASAEKAMVDTVYLSTRKNCRFARLPEVDIEQIDRIALKKMVTQYSPSVQKLVMPRIDKILSHR